MTTIPRRRRVLGLTIAALLGLAACGSSDEEATATAGADAITGTVNVYAAASLKNAFTDLKATFEKANPDATVVLSFDGSAVLATQINQGAPADVFATADEANMDKIGDLASDPTSFATNTLVIITAPGNPQQVESLKDLTDPALKVAICAAEQPCGAASLKAEQAAGITITPVTQETSVSGVVTKVTSGQVDAGLVYVTDAKAAGDSVATVDDPVFADILNVYPITTTAKSANPNGARAFVELVLGDEGQSVLDGYGFGAP